MIDFIHRIPPWFWIALVVHFGVLGTVAYLILLERKVASWVQDRLGPNRVGFDFGIIPFLKGKTFNGLGQVANEMVMPKLIEIEEAGPR